MSSSFLERPVGLVAAAILCAAPMHAAQARALLTACIDHANPSAEMDARVAQAAAVSQGYGLRLEYFEGAGRSDDEFSADNFHKLASGYCQLILGFPVDAQSPALPEGVQATQAYAQTGFALVTRDRPPPKLDDLPKGTAVAVIYETAPNLFFADHAGISADVYTQDALAIEALQKGRVGAAMLWQPSVAQYQDQHKTGHKLFFKLLDEPHARWNLVALYGPDSAAAAAVFEKGVAQLHASGRLAELVAPFAVDVDGPVAEKVAARAALLHAAVGHLLKVANKPKAAGKTPPAIYSAAQATAGQVTYAVHCAMCHGAALEGRNGPALVGEKFASVKSDFVVSDIFIIMSTQMPAGNPGTLSHEDYAAIMAYLLQQNGYPAGAKALTFDEASKSETPLVYSGK